MTEMWYFWLMVVTYIRKYMTAQAYLPKDDPNFPLKSLMFMKNAINLRTSGGLSSPSVLWTYNSGYSSIHVCPACYDVNKDGKLEILLLFYQAAGNQKVINSDGSLVYDLTAQHGYLGTIDYNGRIYVGGYSDYKLYVYDGSDGSLIWSADLGDYVREVVVYDIDDDGELEVITTGNFGIAVFEYDGTLKWKDTTDKRVSIEIGDIDNDGEVEIVTGGSNTSASLRVYAPDGTVKYSRSDNGRAFNIWDVNDDGYMEIFGTYYDGSYNYNRLLKYDGTEIWRDTNSYSYPSKYYSIHDIDGDGNLEIIVSNDKGLTIYNASDGSVEVSNTTDDRSWDACYLADVDGDGVMEIIATDRGGYIDCYENDLATEVWTISLGGYPGTWTFVVDDFDGDGDLEIVCGFGSTSVSGGAKLIG